MRGARTFLFFLLTLTVPGTAVAQGDHSDPAPAAEMAITSRYDSTADSTSVRVELDRGRYRLFSQRPKLAAILQYSGRTPSSWPDTVLIEFTTREPQFIRSTSMLLKTDEGQRVTALSRASRVKQRAFTVEHTVTFAVPLSELQPLLGSHGGVMEVGGIRVRLTQEHFEALGRLVQY